MRPTLAVWIIAKNEARDIGRCLESVKPIADYVILVDTGSTDDTVLAAMQVIDDRPFIYEVYTAASQQVDGNWQLLDFSKARNRAIELAEATEATHWMWMDADDQLQSTAAIKRALYADFVDVFGLTMKQGSSRWLHHRIAKSGKNIRFKGACHEYMVLDGLHCAELPVEIVHDATPGVGESSNARNLRILTEEWKVDPSPRTAFYLANTHKDGARHAEAIDWYRKRIALGDGFKDEWLFSHLYLSRSHVALQQYDEAVAVCKVGLEASGWAEFRMQWANTEYRRGNHALAIDIAMEAMDTDPAPTVLWREDSQYKDQGPRLVSWCYEHLGNWRQALVWAEAAQRRIGGSDLEWDQRLLYLKSKVRTKVTQLKRPVIALHRPGAIGDILMTLNLIPALKAANPGKEVWYFCDGFLGQPEQLGTIMRQAGCDQVLDCKSWEQWSATCERAINLVGYPLQEGYPEKPMQHHLLRYFARELGIEFAGDMACTIYGDLPALTLPRPSLGYDNYDGVQYGTIQITAGWSKYKQWPRERWERVADALEFPLVLLGSATEEPLLGAIGGHRGATLHESIALFANARTHIGIDSFANHLTNYFWQDERGNGRRVPGVILWGSTQASAAGYPHNTNISLGLSCQPCFRENPSVSRMPRGPCTNPPRATYEDETPHACMRDISVERVVEAVREMWARTGTERVLDAA